MKREIMCSKVDFAGFSAFTRKHPTNLLELTICGTLPCPSHVLLMALTATAYWTPHSKLDSVQLEPSVTQRRAVTFALPLRAAVAV